jgi:hypothetical protein
VEPDKETFWGLSERMLKAVPLAPEPEKEHDHRPDNDAYTIAYDYMRVKLGQRLRRQKA